MLKSVIKPVRTKILVFDIVFAFTWTFLECYFVTLLSRMTGEAFYGNESAIKLIVFYFIYLFMWEFAEYVGDINTNMAATDIENNVIIDYFNRLYKINPTVLKSNNTGYINGLLHKLVGYQSNLYSQLVLFLPIAIGYILYFAVSLLKYHVAFTILLLGLCSISTVSKILGNKITKRFDDGLTEAEAIRNKVFADTVLNINTVQKMQANEFFLEKFYKNSDNCCKKTLSWASVNELFFCLFKFISYLFCPLALLILHKLPAGTVTNEPEFLALVSMLTIKLVHTTKSIVSTLVHWQKYKSVVCKLDAIAAKANERKDITYKDFNTIHLKDVHYSYDLKNEDNTTKRVTIIIDNFEVNKGDKICIHGESGQGKTTLLHLLSDEIENQNVYVDNELINSRLDCVFIAQDTEIFDMSLRENLTLGKDIADETLVEYLDAVGLSEWFSKQSLGLDTILGERGVFISTGQRQRLNLVRGLLIQDKEIYLLDEPTSNVDEDTEEKMIDLLNRTLKDKTVIIVTHRPKIRKICNHSYLFVNSILNAEY